MSLFSMFILVAVISVSFGHQGISHEHDDHGDVHHSCIHNHVSDKTKLQQIDVNYVNHPREIFSTKGVNKEINLDNARRFLDSSSSSTIRIKPYYDPATISLDTMKAEDILYIKQLMSSTITYYQQLISVIPVNGPLFIQRTCQSWYTQNDYKNCASYGDSTSVTCGIVQIPDSHFGTDIIFKSDRSSTVLAGGNGISDADLIIYVSYSNADCGGSTLAYASSCYYDQYGRPVGGMINFCPAVLSESSWKKDVITALHEITHVLIMSPNLWENFKDDKNNKMIVTEYDEVQQMEFIITPKVAEYAKEYFDCDSIQGLPLENNGGSGSVGSHWELKYASSEYMGSTIYSSQTWVSMFTLKLMEDSGWYSIDYSYAEPYYWGKNEKCDFFDLDCVIEDESKFPQYFCHANNDNGCSYDHRAPAGCGVYKYGSELPDEYQYFTDSTKGGAQNSEFCPFRQIYSYADSDYESLCIDERGNKLGSSWKDSTYGLTSRCTDIVTDDGDYGYCFAHECKDYDDSLKQYNSLTITIDSENEIECARADAYNKVASLSTSSIQITCPDVDTICGSSTKPFECKYGHYNDDIQACVCSVGYQGTICDEIENSIINEAVAASSSESSSSSPSSTDAEYKICLNNVDDLNGEYAFHVMYNAYPSYKNTNNVYIYWSSWYHEWRVSSALGSGSVHAYCSISEYTENIEDCNGHWYQPSSSWGADDVEISKSESSYCGIDDPTSLSHDVKSKDEAIIVVNDNDDDDKYNKHINIVNNFILYVVGGIFLILFISSIIICIIFYMKHKYKKTNDVISPKIVDDLSDGNEIDGPINNEMTLSNDTSTDDVISIELR